MDKSNIKKIVNLSAMQKGILYHCIKENDDSYIIQILLEIKGGLQINVLRNAFDLLIKEYDVLRTGILYKNIIDPVKLIYRERKNECKVYDSIDVEHYIKMDRTRGFDLETDELIRLGIIKKRNSFVLVITFHHIILDGWSKDIILKRLFEIYSLLMCDSYNPKQFEEIEVENRKDVQKMNHFWSKYLEDYEGQSSLLNKPSAEKKEYNKCMFTLENSKSVREFCLRYNVSVNIFCLLVWGIQLQMLCNSDDVIYGNVIANRDVYIKDIGNTPGLFINTIPIRISKIKERSFSQCIQEFARQYYKCMENGKIPLNSIFVEENSKLELEHLVTFEEKNITIELLNNLNIENIVFNSIDVIEHTQYGLTVTFKNESNIIIEGIYNTEMISREGLMKIFAIYQFLCKQILEEPDIIIKRLKCIDSDTDSCWKMYNKNKIELYKSNIISEFEKIVKIRPNSIALKDDSNEITYEELNYEANYVADVLIKKGIQNKGIALHLQRSHRLISIIIGILKSNNYYVPIEYNYPSERICAIVNESKAEVIIYDDREKILALPIKCKKIFLNNLIGTKKESIPNQLSPNSTAYVMYTSGTTGVPKGVVVSHEGIIRIAKGQYLSVTHKDVILQLSNYAFDGSTFDIYAALLNGASLRIIKEKDIMDLETLAKCIKEEISVFFVTTALFNTLVENKLECLKHVRKILFGGEKASVKHVRKAFDFLGKNKLIHVYGPTESTVFASFYPINEIDNENNIPIGYPIEGTHLYIVNTYGQLQPCGRPGELYIAGTGLAKCYDNDLSLTESKFIYPVFDPQIRVYRTNDLCILSEKGKLEFIDRNDNQVKLRGYRIELGDIQNALLELDYVKDAYVITSRDNENMLKICAYIILEREDISTQLIRDDLQKLLPQFMIPSKIIFLNSFPINQNGKVDKKKLPEIEWAEHTKDIKHEFEGEIEKKLADIWCKVLNVNGISYDSEFYDLGGDSIKAIKMVSQINKLDCCITIKDLFSNSVFRSLVKIVKEKQNTSTSQNKETNLIDYTSQYME